MNINTSQYRLSDASTFEIFQDSASKKPRNVIRTMSKSPACSFNYLPMVVLKSRPNISSICVKIGHNLDFCIVI